MTTIRNTPENTSSIKPTKIFTAQIPQILVQANPQNQLIRAQAFHLVQTSFQSPNQPLTIKLDKDNYLIWKNQLLNVVIANGLEGFLDNTHLCPPKFLELQQLIINPKYSLWKMYNRLIMSWFYAFLYENVMTQIIVI